MKWVAELHNDMLRAGVIRDYAVFGAVAQMRYAEAVATFDAGAVSDDGVSELADRYGLAKEWRSFKERFDER